MAEVVGLTASVLTLAQAVLQGVNLAIDLYKAPEELTSLQGQIETFQGVIRGINDLNQTPTEGIVATTLSRGQHTIEQLNQLITIKLIKYGNGSNRARRRAWVRNKPKILKLQDNLKEARETIAVALSANIMAISSRAEASITAINEQATQTRTKTLGIDRKLLNIENSIDKSRQIAQASGQTIQQIWRSMSMDARPLGLRHHDQLWLSSQESSGFLESSTNFIPTRRAKRLLPPENESQASPQTYHQKLLSIEGPDSVALQDDPAICARPASPFELSASFRPETYTAEEATPKFFSYSSYQEHSTMYTRVNRYEMFFAKTPRQWRRLTLSVTVGVESRYWNLARLSPCANPAYVRPYGGYLPGFLK